MSHYTVGYHDIKNDHYEIGEYATDAWEAQPMIPMDVIYDTTLAMASFAIVAIIATSISVLSLKGKRKRKYN